jgi:hypothetical protein
MPNSPAETGTPNPESYTNNGDGTVTDNVTKLMWEQADSTATYSWSDAKAYCVARRTAGYSDWRLPTQIELFSIVDWRATGNVAFNPVFSAQPGVQYWSVNMNPIDISGTPQPFIVGSDGTGSSGGGPFNVRCVR